MKKFFKRFFLVLLIALIVIQFFQPEKNTASGDTLMKADITMAHSLPADVQQTLKKACYDCHSNNTVYPWYSNIQPVGWWLADHINEGKKELNFSEFAGYNLRRQYRKLEEIKGEIEEEKMPLASYTRMHKEAKLTDTEKDAVAKWVTALRDSMEAAYPKDSLVRKK